MDKKNEKKIYDIKKYLKLGFWIMIGLFVLTIILNLFIKSGSFIAYAGVVVQVLLYLAVLFVFVNSILYLSPEKGFGIIALVISGLLFLILLLTILISGTAAV